MLKAGRSSVEFANRQIVCRTPHEFYSFGIQAFGEAAEINGRSGIVPRQISDHQIDVVLLGVFEHDRKDFDQFLPVYLSNDSAARQPSHRPRRPVAGPEKAVGEHGIDTQVGRCSDCVDQAVHIPSQSRMAQWTLQVDLG